MKTRDVYSTSFEGRGRTPDISRPVPELRFDWVDFTADRRNEGFLLTWLLLEFSLTSPVQNFIGHQTMNLDLSNNQIEIHELKTYHLQASYYTAASHLKENPAEGVALNKVSITYHLELHGRMTNFPSIL